LARPLRVEKKEGVTVRLNITMAMVHFFLGSLNIHLHAPLRQVPIRSMQDVLVAFDTKNHVIIAFLVKSNFCNFTLCMPLPWMPGAVGPFSPPLHAPDLEVLVALNSLIKNEATF